MRAASGVQPPARRRKLIVLLPLLAFLALAALFNWFRLGSGDPSKIPSALIGRPAPQADPPPLAGVKARLASRCRAWSSAICSAR